MQVRSSRHHGLSLGLVAALSLVGAGCADTGGADDPAETDPTASTNTPPKNLLVDVQGDGFTVSYYEPEPGLIVEDEQGTAHARHVAEDRDLDMVQRYELLAGKKAPKNLLEAAARAGIPTHEGEPVMQSESRFDKANPTSSEQWFLDNFCVKTDRFYYRLGVNQNTKWSDGVEYMKAGAWVRSGAIGYVIDYNGAGTWSWGLGPSEYGSRRVTSRIDRKAYSEVSNAWLSTYHHCVNYHF